MKFDALQNQIHFHWCVTYLHALENTNTLMLQLTQQSTKSS